MSDENAAEEHTEGKAPDFSMNDGNVVANWTVAVLPGENVSIHYTVAPADENDAITSVTTSFTLQKDHVVVQTYAGSTTQELINPKAGQGATGNCGVDSSVFPDKPDGDLVAVLAGTVRKGENVANFFFSRPFDPTVGADRPGLSRQARFEPTGPV